MREELLHEVWYRYGMPDAEKIAAFRHFYHAEKFLLKILPSTDMTIISTYERGEKK